METSALLTPVTWLLQSAISSSEAPWVVVMAGTAVAAMFSALLALVWTIIKRYERLLELNSTELKTVLESSNRTLIAMQGALGTANDLIKEQGRSLLSEIREQRAGVTRIGEDILRNQQEFKREIDLIKTRLDYGTRRSWPEQRGGEDHP